MGHGPMELFGCQRLLSPLADQFFELGLDDIENFSHCALGRPRFEFKCFSLCDDLFSWQIPITHSCDFSRFLNLMLADILLHHLIVELVGVFLRQVVVDFPLFRLNDVGLLGICHVSQAVFIIFAQIFRKKLFMLKSSFFLLHQPFGRRDVPWLVVRVEFAHNLVELVHLQVLVVFVSPCCLAELALLLLARVSCCFTGNVIKLLLKRSDFSLVLCVTKLIVLQIGICGIALVDVILSYSCCNFSCFLLPHGSSGTFCG